MKKIKVNINELVDAFGNCSMELRHFLDTKNDRRGQKIKKFVQNH